METPSDKVTKRGVLSKSSKLFDPLGLVTPILVSLKIFIQDLWIDWDHHVNEDLHATWTFIRKGLGSLESIKIPRWFGCTTSTSSTLHGFADASKRAYTACLYYVSDTGPTRLICVEFRVAPVNTISITKLELWGSQLLVQLIAYILPSFTCQPAEIYC